MTLPKALLRSIRERADTQCNTHCEKVTGLAYIDYFNDFQMYVPLKGAAKCVSSHYAVYKKLTSCTQFGNKLSPLDFMHRATSKAIRAR